MLAIASSIRSLLALARAQPLLTTQNGYWGYSQGFTLFLQSVMTNLFSMLIVIY
jgi:hypothetical protein